MRSFASLTIILCAIAALFFSFFGDDGYSSLEAMQNTLTAQHEKNNELDRQIKKLRANVNGLKHDDRVLEKAARNELGMAKPDELIFVFPDKEQE